MSELAKRLDWVPERLAGLLERFGIPGASLAVWLDGEEYVAASGMANLAAGIEATIDTLFLIGSNTKLYTTSLIMQLIERGEVELDAPVRAYVPGLQLSDPEATAAVTVRHLLTHTSGITGDYFPDCGRGDDAVERCVASLAGVEMLHPPGAMFSYCNSGFILAGRLVECVTGQTWDAALRERLLTPLGSTSFATLPEEALLHRVAVGHAPDPETGELRPGRMWPEVRSGGPAGFTPFATASELLLFARMHLGGGVTASGQRLLSTDSVSSMQRQQVDTTHSGGFDSDGWGLGWARYRYSDDERVIGHNGGASALLRVLPERNFAIASLTNAGGGNVPGHHIIHAIVDELFGLRIPTAPQPAQSNLDLAQYEAVYRHHTTRHQVTAADRELMVNITGRDTSPVVLRPIDADIFSSHTQHSDVPMKVAFLRSNTSGRPTMLHIGGRACVRDE